jgi:RNA polymerase sigma factor (TIGR02999 family)
MDQRGDITRLLDIAHEGDSEAMQAVLSLLHDRLRVIAHRQLAREAEGHTLETDGLVNEAFLRLAGVEHVRFRDRQHLLATAARMMRRVLIDYADRRRSQKRGSGVVAVPLNESIIALDEHADDLLALDEALDRLELSAPRLRQVVECRFFAGLSVEETAEVLALSPATVKRDWVAARAWLNRELEA